LKEPVDGDCLILSGMEFQTAGAAKLKALRPMAVVVKGTCSRLCEEERRSLEGALRLMRGQRYEEERDWILTLTLDRVILHTVVHHSLNLPTVHAIVH